MTRYSAIRVVLVLGCMIILATVALPVNNQGGFTITETAGNTAVAESGTTDTFDVVLTVEPTSDVVIDVVSGDIGEATIHPASMTFTVTGPTAWDIPQTVTATGVDDDVTDGIQATTVTLSINDALSDDAYDPLADQTVTVTTTDNDVPGFTVTHTDGNTTVSESGTTDTFSVVLTSQPEATVRIDPSIGDGTEVASVTCGCSVPGNYLEFTPTTWDIPCIVEVTGAGDDIDDGDRTTFITLSVNDAESDDAYDSVNDQLVPVTTTDDDTAGIVVTHTGGDTTIAEGSAVQDYFIVTLSSQPESDVWIEATVNDNTEIAWVQGCWPTGEFVLTPASWNSECRGYVTSADDGVIDGDQTTTITLSVNDALSDDTYDSVNDELVSVTTTDNDVVEIDVSGLGISILDGDTTPSTLDDTDFGDESVSAGSESHTFTISNLGNIDVELTDGPPRVSIEGDHASDFTVVQDATTPISVGSPTTFTVTFDPSEPGERTATISIANNDDDENPYTFAIEGYGQNPNIHFRSNVDCGGVPSSQVESNDPPSVDACTDFGFVPVGDVLERQFRVGNDGVDELLIGNVSWNATGDLTVTTAPSSGDRVVPGFFANGLVTVRFAPQSSRKASLQLFIASNDPDESPFIFNVQGSSIEQEIDVSGLGVSIPDGDTTPSTLDDTSFGAVSVRNDNNAHTFTITNSGDGDLNLTDGPPMVSIIGPHAIDFTLTSDATTPVTGSTTTTFTITFDPSSTGLRTATVSIANDDADENPYEFDIQGTGVSTPSGGGTPIQSTPASATTGTATHVTMTSARLGATIQPNLSQTEAYFEWGEASGNTAFALDPTPPYTHSINANPSSIWGVSTASVFATLTGLRADTTYHYRVVASNAKGTTYGDDLMFTTASVVIGDISGDDSIDLFDVFLCAQFAMGTHAPTPEEETNADCDSDGDVDMDDVTALSEYILGIRGALP